MLMSPEIIGRSVAIKADIVRTLERAGCWVVDDDLLLGLRWLTGDSKAAIEMWRLAIDAGANARRTVSAVGNTRPPTCTPSRNATRATSRSC